MAGLSLRVVVRQAALYTPAVEECVLSGLLIADHIYALIWPNNFLSLTGY